MKEKDTSSALTKTFNSGQSIWNIVKISSKIRKKPGNFDIYFVSFLTTIFKALFLEGRLGTWVSHHTVLRIS